VRNTSTWLGGVIALMVATYGSPVPGLTFAAGVLWSLVNLQLLERLVVPLLGPERVTPAGQRRIAGALFGFVLLFAAGALLLSWLSPLALVLGFSLPLAVIVIKAATLLLLGSRAWTTLVNHRFRAAAAALALAVVTWFARRADPRRWRAGAAGRRRSGRHAGVARTRCGGRRRDGRAARRGLRKAKERRGLRQSARADRRPAAARGLGALPRALRSAHLLDVHRAATGARGVLREP
jgi:hypothetical protein